MSKKPTKRAKAQAERAAAVKAVQAAGYTKRAASKLVESLKSQAANRTVSADAAAKIAQKRKEEFKEQSRLGVTGRGNQYLQRLEAVEEARKALATKGISVPDFIDLAEAAAEGRYHEALRLNKLAAEKARQQAEEAIDEIRQELPKLHGDALVEARENISYLEQRIADITDIYGSGQAANLKNTSIGLKISKLFD